MKESANFKVTGEFNDIIYYKDGRVVDLGWNKNVVVNNASILIAALMKGAVGYSGIKYWAIGSGQESWDVSRPEPTITATKLVNEIYRKPIPAENIIFLNENGTESVVPTHIVQVSLTFEADEAVGKWREFAIFGGNATSTKDSGLNINYKTHGLIEKTNEMTIQRRIKFTFLREVEEE